MQEQNAVLTEKTRIRKENWFCKSFGALVKTKLYPRCLPGVWLKCSMRRVAGDMSHVVSGVTRPSVGCDASRDRVTAREYSHMTTSYYVTIVISPPHALSWLSWMSWMSCPAWHLIFVFLAHPFISPPSHLRSYFHDTLNSERRADTKIQLSTCKT